MSLSRKLRHVQLALFGAILVLTIWNFSTTLPQTEKADRQQQQLLPSGQIDGAEDRLNHRQPRFVLHIGPHKSATTTIQCSMFQSKTSLEQDSIVFLGKVDLAYCGGRKQPQDKRFKHFDTCILDETCWQNVTHLFESYRRQGMDLVISKESISSYTSSEHSTAKDRQKFWSRLEQSLTNWNVTVVMTYRRYYEWLASARGQFEYHHNLQAKPQWPLEMPHTLHYYTNQVLQNKIPTPYPHVNVMRNYSWNQNWNVQVLDIHSTKQDIVQAFLCDVLQAGRTCQQYHPVEPKRTSPSDALLYHRLNIQARLWGWFSKGKPFPLMKQTRRQVEQVWNLSQKDFPKDRPPQSLLEELLNRSLMYEHALGMDSDAGRNDEAHRQAFWGSTDRYCTVNVAKVLAGDDRWRAYYQSL
jgi:hypothetical protein